MIPDCLDGANLTENAAKIVINNPNELSQYFLASLLDSHMGQSQIALRVHVLGQPKLALERIRTIQLPLPPLPEQFAVAAMLKGADESIERGREERDGLQSLKASASDALLSGRVRVSEAL